MDEEALIYLKDTARDIRELLGHIREVVRYMKEAVSPCLRGWRLA